MNERLLWETVRRGLLLIVAAIEQVYGIAPRCPECRGRSVEQRKHAPNGVSARR
jgi:hypothetical protein